MSQPTLVHLSISPWSERARWVLDHHGIERTSVAHTPVIGERRLRKLVGPNHRPATVPVLVLPDGRVLTDSWQIAEHAERVGTGSPLLPPEHLEAIRQWNDRAERVMARARVLVIAGMLTSDASLDASMPPGVPPWARKLARPLSRWSFRWFARKYAADLGNLGAHEQAVRDGLLALREALAGKPYIFDSFTYADIVLTNLVQGVVPVADEYLRTGAAARRAWTNPGLASEFADLVQWRDDLYRNHRRKR